MPRMNGEEFKHKKEDEGWVDPYPKKRGGMRWVTGIIFALVLYVLSTGLAMRLVLTFKLSRTTMETVYMPVIALSEASQPIHEFFNWYIDLWSPHQINSQHKPEIEAIPHP